LHNGSYSFKQSEMENICNRFGIPFYNKAAAIIETYVNKWALTSIELIPSYSSSLVFKCNAARYGSAVFKIGNTAGQLLTEYKTLKQYIGGRFCQVYEVDLDDGVLLEECIIPGNALRDESSLEARLTVFCSLYKDLHEAPASEELYPTYSRWVSRITEYMSRRQDCKVLYSYMKKAEVVCMDISSMYTRKMLLHGDFHHDNIRLGHGGEYKIIDPKGVIGDPVFDIPRFILNEFEDALTIELFHKINDTIAIIETKLSIPSNIIRKCLYVETVMGACWSAEDGAGAEKYTELIKHAAFAEALMNNSEEMVSFSNPD